MGFSFLFLRRLRVDLIGMADREMRLCQKYITQERWLLQRVGRQLTDRLVEDGTDFESGAFNAFSFVSRFVYRISKNEAERVFLRALGENGLSG
jgi:hypothetical protein